MNEENLKLLDESVVEIRYIRRRINDLEDILGVIIAEEKEKKNEITL